MAKDGKGRRGAFGVKNISEKGMTSCIYGWPFGVYSLVSHMERRRRYSKLHVAIKVLSVLTL